jgi:hypothetical protein
MTTETKIEKVVNIQPDHEAGEYIKDDKLYTSLFDYGDITSRDKKVVEEVINIMRERQGVPFNLVEEELAIKFQLKTVPMLKIEDSMWHKLTKDERLGQSTQGFKEVLDDNGNKIRIPHIGFSADLDYLDEFVNRLVNKVASISITEDK